jgi:hypothetical protein
MQLQAENPVVDYYLIKTCKEQIKTHCASSTTSMTVSKNELFSNLLLYD